MQVFGVMFLQVNNLGGQVGPFILPGFLRGLARLDLSPDLFGFRGDRIRPRLAQGRGEGGRIVQGAALRQDEMLGISHPGSGVDAGNQETGRAPIGAAKIEAVPGDDRRPAAIGSPDQAFLEAAGEKQEAQGETGRHRESSAVRKSILH